MSKMSKAEKAIYDEWFKAGAAYFSDEPDEDARDKPPESAPEAEKKGWRDGYAYAVAVSADDEYWEQNE